jgi:hypothetical protein
LISLDTEPPTVKVAELSLTTMQYLSPRTCRLSFVPSEHTIFLLSGEHSFHSQIRLSCWELNSARSVNPPQELFALRMAGGFRRECS